MNTINLRSSECDSGLKLRGRFQFNFFFKLLNSQASFTVDPNTVKGKGVYFAEEWAASRKLTDKLFTEPSELNFRISSYSDLKKLISAFNLCKNFDFSNFSKLGDVGGVPFYQASVIHDINPHLEFLLTDYDHKSCETLKNLPRYSTFEIKRFDAMKDDWSFFNNCDILTMWGVDCVINDSDLVELFSYIKNSKKTLIIASINIDPKFFNYQLYKTISYSIKTLAKFLNFLFGRSRPVRKHATLRNENYFRKLSKIVDVKLETIQVDDLYRIYKVTSNMYSETSRIN